MITKESRFLNKFDVLSFFKRNQILFLNIKLKVINLSKIHNNSFKNRFHLWLQFKKSIHRNRLSNIDSELVNYIFNTINCNALIIHLLIFMHAFSITLVLSLKDETSAIFSLLMFKHCSNIIKSISSKNLLINWEVNFYCYEKSFSFLNSKLNF